MTENGGAGNLEPVHLLNANNSLETLHDYENWEVNLAISSKIILLNIPVNT